MRSARRLNRRGFAMAYAIALLALVSATIMLLTKQISYDICRTKLAAEDAQLRQLLLAGARSAQEHAALWNDSPDAESWKIELPAAIAGDQPSLSISCVPIEIDQVDAQISAQLSSRREVQEIRFQRSKQHWVVGEVKWGIR